MLLEHHLSPLPVLLERHLNPLLVLLGPNLVQLMHLVRSPLSLPPVLLVRLGLVLLAHLDLLNPLLPALSVGLPLNQHRYLGHNQLPRLMRQLPFSDNRLVMRPTQESLERPLLVRDLPCLRPKMLNLLILSSLLLGAPALEALKLPLQDLELLSLLLNPLPTRLAHPH